MRAAREQKIDTLERAVKKVRAFLDTHEDKIGAEGQAKKSNITDNDSAKMKTSKGVIQGYNGVALVDDKRQVVVAAEAFGEGQEHALLQPVLEGARENLSLGPGGGAKPSQARRRRGVSQRGQPQVPGRARDRRLCGRQSVSQP